MSSQTCDVCDVSVVRQQERQVELDSLCNRASGECSVWLQNANINAVETAQRALTDTLCIVGRVLNDDREGEQLRLTNATWDSLRIALGTALDRGAEAIDGARLETPSPSTSASSPPQNSTPSTSSSEQKAECLYVTVYRIEIYDLVVMCCVVIVLLFFRDVLIVNLVFRTL